MGIDVGRFVNVNPELICAICQDVYENPVKTPCGHVFCSSCIYSWVNRSITRENNCPTCRARVDHFHIRPVLPIIKSLLGKQKMYCECSEQGCKEVVAMEKMKAHLEVCPYHLVPCCYGNCEAVVSRKNLKKHEVTCAKRKLVSPNHGCVGEKDVLSKVKRIKRHLNDIVENTSPKKVKVSSTKAETKIPEEQDHTKQRDDQHRSETNSRKSLRDVMTKQKSKRIQEKLTVRK